MSTRMPVAATVGVVMLVLTGWSSTACARKTGPEPSPTRPAAVTTVPGPTPTTPAPTATGSAASSPKPIVISANVAYQWNWPNAADKPAKITHQYRVPPVPQLTSIAVAAHRSDPGDRAYDRMSFTFTTAVPSYEVKFVRQLTSDSTGNPIPLSGLGVLQVTFRGAQAHNDAGQSTVRTAPPGELGLTRMVSYANAGDFEGVLTYGIGVTWPIPHSNPQIAVRVYEVHQRTPAGQDLYVVAIDIDAR